MPSNLVAEATHHQSMFLFTGLEPVQELLYQYFCTITLESEQLLKNLNQKLSKVSHITFFTLCFNLIFFTNKI